MRRIYFALTFSQEEEARLLQYRSQLIECASSLKPIPRKFSSYDFSLYR